MNFAHFSFFRLRSIAIALFLASFLRAQNYEEQGLFPTSMEEILTPRQQAVQPGQRTAINPTNSPSNFYPEPSASELRPPQTVVPNAPPRSQPMARGALSTQVLLPAPQPVAQAIESPNTPTIVFTDTQIGFPEETETGVIGFDPGQLLADKQYEELGPWVIENQDAGMAGALGWSYFEDENYPKSIEWFEQSLRWNENNDEAAYGLALALYNEGYLQQAEAVARWKQKDYPGMQNILGDIYMTRAISSFKAERYSETLDNLDKIGQFRTLTRGEEVLEAWSLYHTGQTEKAAGLFRSLYAAERDRVAAVGLYASLSRDQNWDQIQRLVDQYGGPLADIYALYSSERYYDRRLYLKASQLAPKVEDANQPFIENIASPKVTISAQFISRDGDEGTSELDLAYAPFVTGTVFSDEVNRVDVSLGLVSLDAGNLPDSAFVGLVPNTANPAYVIEPKTSYNGMIAPRVGYYREDWISPYIELGMTPLGGQIDSEFVGRLGVQGLYDTGGWTVEVFRESVTESLLSYTGFRDPYTSLEWGRVVETGLHMSVMHFFGDNLSLYGFMEVGQLSGENVADNEKIRLDVALNRTFEPDYFHYINFGPSFTFYSYTNNLSFFTYGQGGYFSPEYLIQGVMNLQFMTKEGYDYLFKGQIGLGGQANKQADSPIFPLAPDGRDYSGKSDATGILISDLQGMMFLTEYWAFGAEIGYNKTPSYEELHGGIYTTIFFEPREGLVETDFPNYQY